MTLFTRKSFVSGIERTLDLPITQEDWDCHLAEHTLIQDAFPQLSADKREFLMTGITPEEWDDMISADTGGSDL